MRTTNDFLKLRNVLQGFMRFYYTKIWRMNIDATSRFSLSARFDKTHPRGIHIGPESYVAFGAVILTHDMTRGLYLDTIIGRRCFIGARSMILPGVRIGDECIVAAGSIVTKHVPPRCIVGGNPARIIKENIEVGMYGRLKEADANQELYYRNVTDFPATQQQREQG